MLFEGNRAYSWSFGPDYQSLRSDPVNCWDCYFEQFPFLCFVSKQSKESLWIFVDDPQGPMTVRHSLTQVVIFKAYLLLLPVNFCKITQWAMLDVIYKHFSWPNLCKSFFQIFHEICIVILSASCPFFVFLYLFFFACNNIARTILIFVTNKLIKCSFHQVWSPIC